MNRLKKSILSLLVAIIVLISIIAIVGAKTTNSIGDINADGTVSAADARLALRASVGLEKLTDTQSKSADVNNDNKVTASDARMILRVSVGLDKFEIEDVNSVKFEYLHSNPLTCDVGKTENVLFYVDVISKNKIANNDIELYIDDKFVGTLNDDGINGDVTADDNRYSATFPMYSDERKRIKCYIKYENEIVDEYSFLFAKSRTQEEEQMITEFYDDIEKIKDKYRFTSEEMKNDENDCLKKAEQCYYEIKEYLDGRTDLKWTWTGNYTGFGVEFDCYIKVGVPITDLEVTEEANFTIRLLRATYNSNISNASYKSKIITIQPFQSASEFKGSIATDEAAQNIVSEYSDYTFSSNLDNQEITVETMKTLSKYGIVILEGHGGNWEDDGYIISLTERVTAEKNQKNYKDDIDNDRVIPNGNHYVITEKFFDYYYAENDFDNALIYLGTCHGGDDDVLIREILYNKGAEAVISYKNSVIIKYMHKMLPTIFEYMSKGKTIEDAVKKAKMKHGSHDPYIDSDTYNSLDFWDKIWYNLGCIESSTPAEVVLTGNNTSFKLIEYPSTEEITGQIIDKITKQPISNVVIKCDEIGVNCTTGENGIFRFYLPLPRKSHTFSFSHSLYNDIRITVTANSYSMLDIVELSPIIATLTGKVTDSETGNPISNVTVEVIDNESGSLEPVATTTTNENGLFSVNLPFGSYSLSFKHNSFEEYGIQLSIDCDNIVINDPILLNPKKVSSDTVEFNGNYYKLFDLSLSWEEAKAYCENLGGHLVTITSSNEQEFIEDNLLSNSVAMNYYFLGGFRENLSEEWYWITNEDFVYSNWNLDEEATQQINGQNYIIIGGINATKLQKKFSWISHHNIDDSYQEWATKYTGFICEWENSSNIETDNDNNDINTENTCITSCEIIDYGRYTGNQGDSCVFHLDKSGLPGADNTYCRNGNIGIDGTAYNNGLEVWIARWNFKSEKSFAYATYKLNGIYQKLSGKTGIINSYNTTNFDTTVYFYNGDTLLQKVDLTNSDYAKNFSVDVSDVKELKILVEDNNAVAGGTSFALYDMFLT